MVWCSSVSISTKTQQEIEQTRRACDIITGTLIISWNTEAEKEIIEKWIQYFEILSWVKIFRWENKEKQIQVKFLPREEIGKIALKEYEERIRKNFEIAKYMYDKWEVSEDIFRNWVIEQRKEYLSLQNMVLTNSIEWYSWYWWIIYISNNPIIAWQSWRKKPDDNEIVSVILSHEIWHRFNLHHTEPLTDPNNMMSTSWKKDYNLPPTLNQEQILVIGNLVKLCK